MQLRKEQVREVKEAAGREDPRQLRGWAGSGVVGSRTVVWAARV